MQPKGPRDSWRNSLQGTLFPMAFFEQPATTTTTLCFAKTAKTFPLTNPMTTNQWDSDDIYIYILYTYIHTYIHTYIYIYISKHIPSISHFYTRICHMFFDSPFFFGQNPWPPEVVMARGWCAGRVQVAAPWLLTMLRPWMVDSQMDGIEWHSQLYKCVSIYTYMVLVCFGGDLCRNKHNYIYRIYLNMFCEILVCLVAVKYVMYDDMHGNRSKGKPAHWVTSD